VECKNWMLADSSSYLNQKSLDVQENLNRRLKSVELRTEENGREELETYAS